MQRDIDMESVELHSERHPGGGRAFSTHGQASQLVLPRAVAACARRLRRRLDHSHTRDARYRPWRAWPCPMDGGGMGWDGSAMGTLIGAVARLLMRDHDSLHGRPDTPLSSSVVRGADSPVPERNS